MPRSPWLPFVAYFTISSGARNDNSLSSDNVWLIDFVVGLIFAEAPPRHLLDAYHIIHYITKSSHHQPLSPDTAAT